jgi:hypothetical protein
MARKALVTFAIGEKYQKEFQNFKPSCERYCEKYGWDFIEVKELFEPVDERRFIICQKLLIACQEWSKKYERQFGRRQYLEMGSGHLSQLVSIDDTLNLSCDCGGNLMTTIYECNNCGTPIVDMQDFDGSESDLKNLVSRPHTCPACDHVDFLMNKLSCDSCDEPTPLTITSAVLYLQKTGENTSSTLSVARFQQLRDFVVPLDNQPLVGDDLNGIHPGIRALAEPYNFPQMFQGELDRDFQISQFG